VSLARIQKGLRVSESRAKDQQAGTAPTHRRFTEHVTPQIYRAPGLPLSAAAFWLANQFWEKSKKSRCEDEIAACRALLMEGVSVSAPRCTQ